MKYFVVTVLVVAAFLGGMGLEAVRNRPGQTADVSTLAQGKIRVLDTIRMKMVDNKNRPIPANSYMEILCIDGYKYIHLGNHPISGITQMLRWNEEAGRIEAVRCGDFLPMGLHDDLPENASAAED